MSLDFVSLFLEILGYNLGISFEWCKDFLGVNEFVESIAVAMTGHSKRVWATVLLTILLIALASLESWLDSPPNCPEDHFQTSGRVGFRNSVRTIIPAVVLAIVIYSVLNQSFSTFQKMLQRLMKRSR
jgi:hypothetical protein